MVRLSGVLFTARDAAHARMAEAIENGEPLPFNPEGQVVYFTAPATPGRALGPAGPSTASRNGLVLAPAHRARPERHGRQRLRLGQSKKGDARARLRVLRGRGGDGGAAG
ncbi:MAG TPA: fumarate hydratase C-terminal domain-containing protein [Rubrobacteraceae bacterium]|nr:fumarate hydratase C-terminal domain-containing protein [Rubrobacteraceae bacterium]